MGQSDIFIVLTQREHLRCLPSPLVRVQATSLSSLWVWFLCQFGPGLGVRPWESGGSWGQLHHVFRPWMVRRTERKWFLHESKEESAISSALWLTRPLATLRWPCFSKLCPSSFPESGTLCFSLDLEYAWLWNSNSRQLVKFTNGKKKNCILCVCPCLHVSTPAVNVCLTCVGTCVLFLSFHFNPFKICWNWKN